MECEAECIGGRSIVPHNDIGLHDIIELVDFHITESTRIDNADCAVAHPCSPLPPAIIDNAEGIKKSSEDRYFARGIRTEIFDGQYMETYINSQSINQGC